jgi:3-methyladenine DNA glycosylase AlkC
MEPFKNIFNPQLIKKVCLELKKFKPSFDDKEFSRNVLKSLDQLEMKDRVRLIAYELNQKLPANNQNITLLTQCLKDEKTNPNGLDGFEVWPLTQYIEDYGLEYYDCSMQALYKMTKVFTAEFAVRAYLNQFPQKTLKLLHTWVNDDCHHIRRLISEGTRPNLPWGHKVDYLYQKPELALKLIEKLTNDESLYVRKSVANHLNDISHYHPEIFFSFLAKLNSNNKKHQWIIRHASRTLLKAGDLKAYQLNNFPTNLKLKNCELHVSPKSIKENDKISFNIEVLLNQNKAANLLMKLKIHYVKKNNQKSPKVFHLKEIKNNQQSLIKFTKVIHFKKVSTRSHYEGIHQVELLINGKTQAQTSFKLTK